MFDRSKLESLRDVNVTRIGDTFPTVFRRLYGRFQIDFMLLVGSEKFESGNDLVYVWYCGMHAHQLSQEQDAQVTATAFFVLEIFT